MAVVLTPIVLFLLITLLLYIPPVQNWAVKQIASYASEQTGKSITIGHVSLSFPLDLQLNNFRMTQPNDSIAGLTDTIANVESLVTSVRLKPLLHSRVVVDGLELRGAQINTAQFIADTRIKARIGRLSLRSDGVDLTKSLAHVNVATLQNASVDVALGDSVPPDTTPSRNFWKIMISRLQLSKTAFALHMPGDSMRITSYFGSAEAKGARLLLHDGQYEVASLDWHNGSLSYDRPFEPRARKGFDANHIALTQLNIGLDSFSYLQPNLRLSLRSANFKEQAGLTVSSFVGPFRMDSASISLPALQLATDESKLSGRFRMDLNTFSDLHPGQMSLDINGYLGKNDILCFMPSMPSSIVRHWPDKPLTLQGHVGGNLTYLMLRPLRVALPTVADLTLSGWMAHAMSNTQRRARFNVSGRTYNMSLLMAQLPVSVRKMVRIPQPIGWNGRVMMDGGLYQTAMSISQGGGRAFIKGYIRPADMSYSAFLDARNFNPDHFLPHRGLHTLTGSVSVKGVGTDITSPRTTIIAKADIRRFGYQKYDLNGIKGQVSLANGLLHANINSRNSMASGQLHAHGKLSSRVIDMRVGGNISSADLRKVGIVTYPYVVGGKAELTLWSNMRDFKVSGSIADATLRQYHQHKLSAPLAAGTFHIDASRRGKLYDIAFNGYMSKVDAFALGMADKPLTTALRANIKLQTDLAHYYKVNGNVGDVTLRTADKQYQPKDMSIDALTRRDTTRVFLSGGDFLLDMGMDKGYKVLLAESGRIMNEVKRQYRQKWIDQKALFDLLPQGYVRLKSGPDNLVSELLRQQGYAFRSADVDLVTSPTAWLNGTVVASALSLPDSLQLDSVNLALATDSGVLRYNLAVLNQPANSYPYKGYLQGELLKKGLTTHASILDEKGRTGLDLSLLAAIKGNGINLSITSPKSIIGYKSFAVNDSNYVYMRRDKRISANMKLMAKDGAGVQLFTDDEDSTSLQNITLSMKHFELGKVFAILPYAPSVSGVLDGDYHAILTKENLTISSDMDVKDLVYQHCPMGNVGTRLVYMPQSDGTHYVDAVILQDDEDVGSLTGTYNSKGRGTLDAVFSMEKFPLDYINGFVPDRLIGLRGVGEGSLTLKGPLDALDINGEVYLDSAHIFSEPYGVDMRFANDPVLIKNSQIKFENFEMFANNDAPLDVAGSLDFSNLNRMMLNVRMKAENFEIIDAKENPRSQVYGKAFVNFYGGMSGPLDQLTMRGKLDVLGSTDMTYVLRESNLVTDNQLDELVKFTNLTDTTADVVQRPDIKGFNMGLDISVDEQAHILCALNAEHSNYIDLMGGGNLLMTYDPVNDLRLTGRYTLNDGKMKYSLPVIPLRTFQVQDGSYIEFTGNPYTPTLSITATESLKATVANGTSQGKVVDFNCGVRLSKQFPQPGVEFIIEAPEDMEVQNQLNTKSVEERSKLAVSMLASGLYLDESNSGKSFMNSALASFMQSEINNITGNALRSMGLDITANMESTADATGNLHTDYTFNFSKRLWNNRLRVVMGGRVSTGSQISEDNGAYFDNFSLEYRLNKNETQYLKLYYEREAFDWLEGNLSEFGGGFMWRRKLRHFKDIFNFRTQKDEMPASAKPDTILNKKK